MEGKSREEKGRKAVEGKWEREQGKGSRVVCVGGCE